MKKFLASLLTVGLAVGVGVSAVSASYAIVFGNTTTGAGTIQLGLPHASSYTVTSKFNQPRNTGAGTTNPHNGVDLGSAFGTNVIAPWSGWIVSASPSAYEMFMYLDLNNDSVKNDNAYVKFDHLSSIAVSSGYVAKGAYIAKSGSEGGSFPAHLHFGVRRDDNADGISDVWVRNEPYYRHLSYYDYGKMMDFMSLSTWVSNTAAVTMYPHDEGGKEATYAGNVVIFHRKVGTATWTATTATKSGDQFSVSFTGRYPAGTSVQWMARAVRSEIVGTTYYWAYHPPKFQQPGFDPNATSYAFDFFTNTVQ